MDDSLKIQVKSIYIDSIHMYRIILLCFSLFFQCQEQEDCDTPFDLALEDNDEKYLAFMEELEKLTFNVADNCDDPKLIDELIWNYR